MNRDVQNAIKGYKIDLQKLVGSKMPASLLQFVAKHTYFRKVIISSLDSHICSCFR